MGDAQLARLGLQRVAPAALTDDQQIAVGDRAQDGRPGFQQGRVALLRLQTGDHADDLRAGLHPVLPRQRAARILVVVALEVHAVVDEADRDDRPAFVDELRLDGAGDGDESIELRRQFQQGLTICLGPDAAGMGRGDQVRAPLAGLAQRDDGARRDRLGAIHVGVDDVRPDFREMGCQGTHGDDVVRLIDDEDRDARLLELADGTAGRQGDDRHVVARGVHPGDQGIQVFLGAAVGPGREDLHDSDPSTTGQAGPLERCQARIPGQGGTHLNPPFA